MVAVQTMGAIHDKPCKYVCMHAPESNIIYIYIYERMDMYLQKGRLFIFIFLVIRFRLNFLPCKTLRYATLRYVTLLVPCGTVRRVR